MKWVKAVDEMIANAERYLSHSCAPETWYDFEEMLQDFRRRHSVLQEAFNSTVEAKTVQHL